MKLKSQFVAVLAEVPFARKRRPNEWKKRKLDSPLTDTSILWNERMNSPKISGGKSHGIGPHPVAKTALKRMTLLFGEGREEK